MKCLFIVLGIVLLAGCAKPLPPQPPSTGPSIGLISCADFPSILVFIYPGRELNTRLASMTTREFFTGFVRPSVAVAEINRFCAAENSFKRG